MGWLAYQVVKYDVAITWLLAIHDDLDSTTLAFDLWRYSIVVLKVVIDGQNATQPLHQMPIEQIWQIRNT
jgi:hypothetical protein